MKTKNFALAGLSILSLIFLMSFVSAGVDFLDSEDATIISVSETVQQGSSVTISFKAFEDGTGDLIAISFNTPITMTYGSYTFDSDNTVSGAITSLDQDDTSVLMTLTFDIPEFQEVGTYDGILTLTGTYTGTSTTNLPITLTVTEKPRPEEVNACAVTGNTEGDLQLKIEDVTIVGFGGDEDFEWSVFDEIEIEIEVENDNNDYKIEDITIGWGLYNEDTEEWYIDDEENDFNLKDGEKESVFLTLNLDDDIDELAEYSDDYVLYVWANAVLDDGTEKALCTSLSEVVTIMDESDFIILNNIQYTETASCGSQVQITADVWNIGSEVQEEVYILIESEEFGTQRVDLEEIDEYEDEEINFLLDIPQDTEEGQYMFYLSVYDEYGDIYENDNEDKSRFPIQLTVEGNCINEPKATISADLESEAKAGRDLVVKATIVNTGVGTSTFDVSVDGYNSWASFTSIDSESIVLEAGESAEVLITLNVNSGISGNQDFNIILAEGQNIKTQPVAVMIEKGFGLTGGIISEGNWPIWTIGAINVVLIFVIILVALKVAKKQ